MRRALSEYSDEELDSSSQPFGLDRYKSIAGPSNGSTKPSEEDRHRRTIIIEKKKNSYGFTLQSYGIHYKKEQEVEMLTYVDHVEYDGPAYKAGMREGDVILSINGVDMEKADHNRLVAFIKDCDTRMRMVVLFEDCVRKVGLHMRYIQLQNMLQTKVSELEGLLQREREILEGKWKTHSLPARKKANQTTTEVALDDDIYPGNQPTDNGKTTCNKTNTLPMVRTSAQSTENVGKLGQGKGIVIKESFTPNAQVLLSYQYMDPTSRSNLKSSNSSGIDSAGCLAGSKEERLNYYHGYNVMNKSDPNINSHEQNSSNCSTLSKKQQTMEIVRDEIENDPPSHQNQCQYYSSLQENQNVKCESKNKSGKAGKTNKQHCHQSYYCNPCMGHFRKDQNQDNVSLDAYDLASSCCDPHQCVPIKRRSRHQHKDQNPKADKPPVSTHQSQAAQSHHHHHHHHHHQKHKHKHGSKEERTQRPKSQSNLPSGAALVQPCVQKIHTRYYDLNQDLTSRCSLHSPHNSTSDVATSNASSYCTSLSADTLNDWDDPNAMASNSWKSLVKVPNTRAQHYPVTVAQPQTAPPQQFVTRLYHHHTVQIQPAPDYQYQQNFIQKPKSWDNLTTKAVGGYGFGYGYVEANRTCGNTLKSAHPDSASFLMQQQPQHALQAGGMRKTVYHVENYAPPPTQFVQQDHQKTTTTTIITTQIATTSKSTENLIKNSSAADV